MTGALEQGLGTDQGQFCDSQHEPGQCPAPTHGLEPRP